MPDRRPQLFLTARVAYTAALGVRHGVPGSGELLDHAMDSLTGLHADAEHGGWLSEPGLGHPQDDLRPRARGAGLGDGAHGRPPGGGRPARPGRRRRRDPALGPAGRGAARVVRPRLVRLRGLPGGQRQHARPRGVHRHGQRHRRRRVARARAGDRRPVHQRRRPRAGLAAAGALHRRLGGAARVQPRRAAAPVPAVRRHLRPLAGVVALPPPARRLAAGRVARRGSSRRPTA